LNHSTLQHHLSRATNAPELVRASLVVPVARCEQTAKRSLYRGQIPFDFLLSLVRVWCLLFVPYPCPNSVKSRLTPPTIDYPKCWQHTVDDVSVSLSRPPVSTTHTSLRVSIPVSLSALLSLFPSPYASNLVCWNLVLTAIVLSRRDCYLRSPYLPLCGSTFNTDLGVAGKTEKAICEGGCSLTSP
jgi:hypothetical protein